MLPCGPSNEVMPTGHVGVVADAAGRHVPAGRVLASAGPCWSCSGRPCPDRGLAVGAPRPVTCSSTRRGSMPASPRPQTLLGWYASGPAIHSTGREYDGTTRQGQPDHSACFHKAPIHVTKRVQLVGVPSLAATCLPRMGRTGVGASICRCLSYPSIRLVFPLGISRCSPSLALQAESQRSRRGLAVAGTLLPSGPSLHRHRRHPAAVRSQPRGHPVDCTLHARESELGRTPC